MSAVRLAPLLILLTACAASGSDAPLDFSTGAPADLAAPTPPASDLATRLTDGPPPATSSVRFVAIGDTGKGNAGQLAVAGAIQTKCQQSGCDFVVLLGDNIYDSGISAPNDPQMQEKFEIPYAAIDLPFYVVLGNHDYGGGGTGNEFAKPDNEVAYTALSTKWKLPARTYHFPAGPAELFVADTNAAMWGLAGSGPQQLSDWMAASQATWKIVLGHHPYLSNGQHGNAGKYDGLPAAIPIAPGQGVRNFIEERVCGKADLYLCGHDHDRQWLTDTCQGTELAVSGAGASTTALKGSNPTRFQAATLGFLYVAIEGKTLNASFIDVNGVVEFTRTLTK